MLTQKWRPLIDETGPSDESNRITIRTGTTLIVGAEDSISNDDDRIRYIIKSSALRSDDDSKIMAARAFRAREPETNFTSPVTAEATPNLLRCCITTEGGNGQART